MRRGGVSTAIRQPSSATMDAMTELLSRPIRRVKTTPEGPRRPVALGAMVAASWSAAVGVTGCVVVAVVAWFAADTGSFGGSIRAGALGWLVANGAGLHLASVTITAIPFGTCLVTGWLLYRGGRWVGAQSAVDSLLDVAVGAVSMAMVYCGAGLAVFALTRSGDVHADLLRTVVATWVLGSAFGGLGVLRGSEMTGRLLEPLPEAARAALAGGAAGFFAMVAASALLLTVSLGAHFSSAMTLAESLHAGLVGGAVLALVGVAAVPNAVLCAGAFMAGPGFAIGTGTSVTPGEVTLGPLPAIPLLAALPRTGGAWWQTALILVPMLAGAVAGLVAVRRYPVSGYHQAGLRGGLAGLVGGIGFGASTWLATGAIGPGRMRDIGPDVPATLMVCGLSFLFAGAAAAVAARCLGDLRGRRRAGDRASLP